MELDTYFLGDHRSELDRLGFQARAWRDVTLALCREAGIAAGARVIEVGCGPGFLTRDLCLLVGAQGHVLAVDKSGEFLAVLRARAKAEATQNVSILEHDIAQAPIPSDAFDFVVSRWVDPYVDDLEQIVAKELQWLKPGGRVIHLGTFNYQGACIGPWSDVFESMTRKIIEFYTRNGRRISAGNLVPAILCARGASIVTMKNISPLACPGDDLWEWYRQFTFSMVPRLLDAGLLNAAEVSVYRQLWDDWSRTPGAFISVPSHLGVIAQKPI
jgi:ubiquinone/menaquinone biosynthesis C-methylase UbiE